MSLASTKSRIEMVRDRSGSAAVNSSSVSITYSPSPRPNPFTILDWDTSRPVRSFTFLYRIRSAVPDSNWLKWIVLSWVAEYRPTGTLTSPKLRDPDQIARAIVSVLPSSGVGVHHPVTPVRHTGDMATAPNPLKLVTLAARGLAELRDDDLRGNQLNLELEVSVWLRRSGAELSTAPRALLALGRGLLGVF